MNKLWGWLAAIGAAMVVALQHVAGQRDNARRDAESAQRDAESAERAAEKSKEVRDAQKKARQQAETERQARESRPSGSRPSGNFGRLRDD